VVKVKAIEIIGLESLPLIKPGDDIPGMILEALKQENISLKSGDVLLIAQTIISKSTNVIRDLRDIKPSKKAMSIYEEMSKKTVSKGLPEKSPELIECILNESKKIVQSEHVLITETKHGFVCANAGIDKSNVEGDFKVTLLPVNSDIEAERIRKQIEDLLNIKIAVIITDSFGRPFRNGAIGAAIGISGMEPLLDKRGAKDLYGYQLQTTIIAQADNLASAAQLVMGETNEGIPAVVIRGYRFSYAEKTSIKSILRSEEDDLFNKDEYLLNIEKFLKSRRSYKAKFSEKEVSQILVKKCIEFARWAPSAHNSQPWRYMILEKNEKRTDLIKEMNAKLKKDLESDSKSPEFIANKINKTKMNFFESPYLILICLDINDLEIYNDVNRSQKEELMGIQSVSSSITYFLLALHSQKLAACWYCAPLFSSEIVKETLHLPASYVPLAFVTVGYPEREQKSPPRKHIDEIIFDLKSKEAQ